MKTGLCSITFRRMGAEEVAALTQEVGLDAIEWGGDMHVPPGDVKAAESVRRIMKDACLETVAYGSYYRGVDADGQPVPFDPVLETAIMLGTDTIRVWAGHIGSDGADPGYRRTVIEQTRRAVEMAAAEGIRLGLEFHAGTLCDHHRASRSFLDAVDHPALYTYWQPEYWLPDVESRLRSLEKLGDRVSNLHVFNWRLAEDGRNKVDRHPLEENRAEWQRYLEVPLAIDVPHYALIEYVPGDDPRWLASESATLRAMVATAEVHCMAR